VPGHGHHPGPDGGSPPADQRSRPRTLPHSHRPALTRPAGIRSGRCTPPSGRQPGHGAASLSGRAAAGVQMISSVRQLSPHAPSLPGANARTGRCNTDGRASFQDRRHRQGKGSCHDRQPGQCLQADTPAASDISLALGQPSRHPAPIHTYPYPHANDHHCRCCLPPPVCSAGPGLYPAAQPYRDGLHAHRAGRPRA
jgi:hypothetical protein